jgi:hypothetical protein
VFLCATGAEALYADMGHFGARPIRFASYGLVLPCLLLNYSGQTAIVVDGSASANPFFSLCPEALQVPLVVLATIATIIAEHQKAGEPVPEQISKAVARIEGDQHVMPYPRGAFPLQQRSEASLAADEAAVLSPQSGYIRFVNIGQLVAVAKAWGISVHVARRVGQFVPAGVPLVYVSKPRIARCARSCTDDRPQGLPPPYCGSNQKR